MNMADLAPEEFAKTSEAVREARIKLFDATEEEIAARAELMLERARFIREGLQGSNQAQRDAELETLLYSWRLNLERTEKKAREARLDHELAVLDFDSLKYQLRAAETALRLEHSETLVLQ